MQGLVEIGYASWLHGTVISLDHRVPGVVLQRCAAATFCQNMLSDVISHLIFPGTVRLGDSVGVG